MKTLLKVLIAALFLLSINAQATPQCNLTKTNGGGFTTTIESVVNNCNSSYTISLIVSYNGASGPFNNALSHFSVEAIPGTYANVMFRVVSGNMNNGYYLWGPIMGQNPFQGFIINGFNNIGGVVDGSFRITYTLYGNLQSQRVSCKAGTNNQIVTFSVEDFKYVSDCNNTNCNVIADTDGDGCNDAADLYPNDSTKCMENDFPAFGNGTLAFEDMWPSKGDYDFNDLILDYRIKIITNSNNFVKEAYFTFIIRAFGAGFHNGFGFQIGNNSILNSDLTVTGYNLKENYINLNSNGTEAGQSIPTVIVFDNCYKIMPYPGAGIGVNASSYLLPQHIIKPETIIIKITFTENKYNYNDININTFNPFLIKNQNRGVEVHLPNYHPTDLVDQSKFGTKDDNTNPALNNYYKTSNNLPWALNLYKSFHYMSEQRDISRYYTKFAAWAESNGILFPDWYYNPNYIRYYYIDMSGNWIEGLYQGPRYAE